MNELQIFPVNSFKGGQGVYYILLYIRQTVWRSEIRSFLHTDRMYILVKLLNITRIQAATVVVKTSLVLISEKRLGGGFKIFVFSPLFGEDFQFDEHIFQRGWFNHQLDQNLCS